MVAGLSSVRVALRLDFRVRGSIAGKTDEERSATEDAATIDIEKEGFRCCTGSLM
jgi:hypothetical protein